MALKKTWNPDTGFHYKGEHVVLVGPIQGYVTLPDGSVVDVSDHAVEAESPEHAAQIAHAVATRYAEEGHPTDPTFTYQQPKSKKG